MFSDLGLRQSIVQNRRGSEAAFLNTAWMLQIARGALLWIIALLISLLIYWADRAGVVPPDSVYADPSLPWVIAVLSFGTVIAGFSTTKEAEASRNLALGRVTQIELMSQIAGLACMLAWASFDRSIWVLVAGGLSTSLTSVLLGHVFLPGTNNQWHWDSSAFVELVQFGKWVFASSILGFVVANSDRLLLGWLIDVTTLGVYVIAFSMYVAVEQLLTRITSGIALPALSEVARERRDLKAAYYQFHGVIASVAYLCSGVLMTSGTALIGALYDHRYADSGWMLQVLAVLLLTTPFQISTQCYLALGIPQLHSRILVGRVIALFAGVPLGFHAYGLPGAVWGVVIGQLASVPLFLIYNARNGILDTRSELRVLPIIAVGMGLGQLVALAIQNW